ncbi:hypothetical protein E4K10_10240 [Streptomyces sp. T1317-0309]|nr:hypothetical protein E4K10_10240 [Streptomyces sp. T1317-0309]
MVARLAAGVRDEQLLDATPCPGFTVRTLLAICWGWPSRSGTRAQGSRRHHGHRSGRHRTGHRAGMARGTAAGAQPDGRGLA